MKNSTIQLNLKSNPRAQHAFVTAFTLCLVAFLQQTSLAQPGRGPSAVAVGKVFKIRRAGSESFVGTIQPMRKSVVGTAVDGRVVSIDLKPGDPVDADPSRQDEQGFVGQPIMQLRTGTLEIEMGAAKIQLRLAEEAAKELAASLPKEIELANANARESTARLQYSKTDYERSRRLSGSGGAISQGELELARSLYLADQQSAQAAKIEFEKQSGTRELRLIQSRLRVDAAQAEVTRLNDLKAKYTIRAPFKGYVTQRLTDVGEWVTKGQPIVEVVQLDPIELIINTPQEHLQRFQQSLSASSEGSPLTARIAIEGLDENLSGVVKRIVSQADLRSRTFPVRIEIENPNDVLQPGMLGRATLAVGAEQDMLMVKKDALVLGGGRAKVFKVIGAGEETKVVDVSVVTGASSGDWIQVTGDLTEKDSVVLLGNERLRPGQAIKVTKTIEDTPDVE